MKSAHKIAISIVLILIVWMSLGIVEDKNKTKPVDESKAEALFLVEVMDSKVQSMPLVIQAVG